MIPTWTLLVFVGISDFGSGITTAKIEGFTSAANCEAARKAFAEKKTNTTLSLIALK